MNSLLGEESTLDDETKTKLGEQVRCEVLPYFLLTGTAERWYSKPRGYAGDYMTIEELYQNQPKGVGRIGAILDRCFLDLPARYAVQNRRRLLVEEIERTISDKKENRAARIVSLASGPAREIFDVFERLDDPNKLFVTLLDADYQALAYVSDKAARRKLTKRLRLIPANLIHLMTGKQKIDFEPQDLVYSIGLIDYFQDKFVIRMLNYIHNILRPGGRVILGNFHPRNPTRALMDYVLGWQLIYRTEEDMNRIFMQSAFQQACTRIRFEEQRINLFAECIKPG